MQLNKIELELIGSMKVNINTQFNEKGNNSFLSFLNFNRIEFLWKTKMLVWKYLYTETKHFEILQKKSVGGHQLFHGYFSLFSSVLEGWK